jgi:hypothetical protein
MKQLIDTQVMKMHKHMVMEYHQQKGNFRWDLLQSLTTK